MYTWLPQCLYLRSCIPEYPEMRSTSRLSFVCSLPWRNEMCVPPMDCILLVVPILEAVIFEQAALRLSPIRAPCFPAMNLESLNCRCHLCALSLNDVCYVCRPWTTFYSRYFSRMHISSCEPLLDCRLFAHYIYTAACTRGPRLELYLFVAPCRHHPLLDHHVFAAPCIS
jgi:hypothetical protein